MVNNLSRDGTGFELRLTCPWGCPGGSDSKESACNTGNLGREDPLEKEMATHSSILVSCILQYPLENPMYRGAWKVTVYRVAKSQIPLK